MDEKSGCGGKESYSKGGSPHVLLSGKNWILSIAALVLFYLSVNGVIERTVGSILMVEKVYRVDQEFLNRSLVTAMGHFFLPVH